MFRLNLNNAIVSLLAIVGVAVFAAPALTAAHAVLGDGVITVQSAYGLQETVERLRQDIEAKGIKFFAAIDQAELGNSAGIKLNPSTLLVFGNPPLGIQFLTANPYAGLDWPVRLLVTQNDKGEIWLAYTDFNWIAKRHHITDREAQFKMASDVIGSITSSVTKK
jgi:uncharacterized protein (DUF302 family)